ncbi:hypothetical protein THAOC_35186 [Thalassiosira oceanica]|uniref:Uncharacterized protein n=1 Tax=Thalassiosira oceanica TaxID=159749 RepID=K0R3T6_THAOC|nr:hypothetical protein THAOC_35186 [Thalassiosira oceanica]|eukprot:EJK46159.1 hypothetical protein THAOC_35186 [Thalassiosira oceanica]
MSKEVRPSDSHAAFVKQLLRGWKTGPSALLEGVAVIRHARAERLDHKDPVPRRAGPERVQFHRQGGLDVVEVDQAHVEVQ